MFVDRVKIKLIAGKGGNGIVAWRREKFIPKGGPTGGNGGRGGNIIFQAESGLFSLESYRHKRIIKAKNGLEGGPNLRQGRSGEHLLLQVPYGTLVKDPETGEILYDFTEEAPKWTACIGGRGGIGNNFFKTSTNQAPNKCTPGAFGEEKELELELKLIADIGLVGMPNAGKSTLMSQITHAKVKIGAYPFTTLCPNLSFVQNEDYTRMLVADIPGIIENAHLDKGLGFQFLRHIERTSALLFVIDASGEEGRDPTHDFEVLQNELKAYKSEILQKPILVAFNKVDKEGAKENVEAFKTAYPDVLLHEISALEGKGLSSLINAMNAACLSRCDEYQPA